MLVFLPPHGAERRAFQIPERFFHAAERGLAQVVIDTGLLVIADEAQASGAEIRRGVKGGGQRPRTLQRRARRVVFAVARGVGRAGGARYGIASSGLPHSAASISPMRSS